MPRLTVLWIGLLIGGLLLLALFGVVQLGKMQARLSSQILVSTIDVPRGGHLSTGQLTWKKIPIQGAAQLYFNQGDTKLENLNNAIALRQIPANTPILRTDVITYTETAPYTQLLRPGMRAITVPIQSGAAITDLIQPGDIVDVILTYPQNKNNTSASNTSTQYTSKTLIAGVLVLDTSAKSGQKASPFNQDTNQWAILELTPQQVEQISIATKIGQLSLSLKGASSSTANITPVEPISSEQLIGQKNNPTPKTSTITIIRGTKKTTVPGD